MIHANNSITVGKLQGSVGKELVFRDWKRSINFNWHLNIHKELLPVRTIPFHRMVNYLAIEVGSVRIKFGIFNLLIGVLNHSDKASKNNCKIDKILKTDG